MAPRGGVVRVPRKKEKLDMKDKVTGPEKVRQANFGQ
jgi:hypothetical protein